MIRLYNGDCLEAMREMEDNAYDLAVCDPPYGIDITNQQLGGWAERRRNKGRQFKKANWDKEIPPSEYFTELFRVSKNRIICGGNYFPLPPTKGIVIWDKNNGDSKFSDGELLWTSFDKPLKIKKIHWTGSASLWEDTGGKIHPTQKPVALYTWLLDRYAKPGDKILDTHLGSGSIAIACHNLGYSLDAWELDEEYYQAALHRLTEHQKQLRLF